MHRNHSRPKPIDFAPLQPPQVMWCLQLHRPVLLIGHWVDAKGLPVMAEVMTMSTPRQPYQLAALKPIHVTVPNEDTDA
jgi:hypothetical protein